MLVTIASHVKAIFDLNAFEYDLRMMQQAIKLF